MKKKIIGFWKPNKKYGEFSQWFKKTKYLDCLLSDARYLFNDEDYCYKCAEQYMMAQKALLFNDREMFDIILDEDDPEEMKQLGKEIKNFDSEIWDKEKFNIVYTGNLLKFSQNDSLRELLLSTGDAILCEASPYDKVWGIGMDTKDPRFKDPDQWEGENLLGKALMKVREELRNEK